MSRLLRALLFPGLPILLVGLFPLARPAAQAGSQPDIAPVEPVQLIALPQDSYTRVGPPAPLHSLRANATAAFPFQPTVDNLLAAFRAAVFVDQFRHIHGGFDLGMPLTIQLPRAKSRATAWNVAVAASTFTASPASA